MSSGPLIPEPEAAMHSKRASLRVLVVDDQPIIADTFAAILIREGHQAHTACSAEEAVELAAKILPDVVITDVVMGKMSGIDLAIHLARENPECRVLLISGNIQAGELLEQMEKKGFRFPLVAKPVHPAEILSFISGAPSEASIQ